MRKRIRPPAVLVAAALALVVALGVAVAFAENIDPFDSGDQYAWGENVGWLNAEPANCSDCGVEVSDTDLTGYMWGENIGWINLSCQNNATCGTVNYGVTNDGAGNLAGYAWGENVGWISFSCSNTSYCGFVDYGVTIDPASGEFSGYAWAENVGWISLDCSNTGSCGTVDYGVTTAWFQDTDGDGWPDPEDNCPLVPTPWFVPVGDDDCDAFTTADENFITTDPNDDCPDNTSDDAWPPDFNNDETADIFDVNILKPAFFSSPPGPPYTPRVDLNTDSTVDIFDINIFKPFFFVSCTP